MTPSQTLDDLSVWSVGYGINAHVIRLLVSESKSA